MRLFRQIEYFIRSAVLHWWKKPERIAAPVVVVLDNRFKDFFGQIDYLFSSGFLPPQTEILTRFRKNNYTKIKEGAKRYGIRVHFYTAFKTMPTIADGAILVYPFHAPVNYRLMLNRSYTHVFIGHGDSNKKSSCNPFLRAYDYILIAGSLSRDRLVSNGILRPIITRDHSICIGTSAIDERHALLYNYCTASDGGVVGYFPTWEGGNDGENYCSIEEEATTYLLTELCRKLGTRQILVDPHPNIGQRRPSYRAALRSLVSKLLANGLEVQVRLKVNKKSTLEPLKELIQQKRVHLRDDKASLCYAAVDVSAAEGIVALSGIPSAVLWRNQCDLYPPSSYIALRGDALIPLNEPDSVSKFLASAGTEADLRNQANFRHALFSFDDPTMRAMTHGQRWEYIRDRYFQSPQHREAAVSSSSKAETTRISSGPQARSRTL